MAGPLIDDLAHVELDAEVATRLRLNGRSLRLRRAWPRSTDHLLVEYVTDRGQLVAGQWMRAPDDLESVYDETLAASPEVPCAIANADGTSILLQPQGADRHLSSLAPLIALDGSCLIAHRPERRATVRLDNNGTVRFAKVVRPKHLAKLSLFAKHIQDLPDRSFGVLQLVEIQPQVGVTIWSALEGANLYELIASEAPSTTVRDVGGALRTLHEASPPTIAPIHDAKEEVAVLRKWCSYVQCYVPGLFQAVRSFQERVCTALLDGSSPAGLLHRDFYDKQIFIQPEGRVGLLDFDTLAIGEPALDLANFLVHLQLRALQGLCSQQWASRTATVIVDSYAPAEAVLQRLNAYADATRLRLACVYAFRPQTMGLSGRLLEQIGSGLAAIHVG